MNALKTKTKSALLAAALLTVTTGASLGQTQEPVPDAQPGDEVESKNGDRQTTPQAPVTVPGPGPARRPQRAERPLQADAFRVGSFLAYPELLLTGFYDSNVYAENRDKVSDTAGVISPALWLQSDWRRHAVNLYGGADFTRYDTYSTENTNDWRVSAEGRYDFSTLTNVYGGLRYARDHEDRESREPRNGLEPTVYYTTRGYAGGFHQFGAVSARLAGSITKLDYDDVPFETQSGQIFDINNDDRDRTRYAGGLRLGYEVSPRLEPFVQVAIDNRRYQNTPDDLGFLKDSNGQRAYVGLRGTLPGQLKAEVFAGYMWQAYKDNRLKDVSTPGFGANVIWAAARDFTLSLYADRTVEETTAFTIPDGVTIVEASSYINTYASLIGNYRFTDRWFANASLSGSRVDYQGFDRVDDYFGVGGGVTYRAARWAYVNVAYQYRQLKSDIPSENFNRNQVYLRLAFPFSP